MIHEHPGDRADLIEWAMSEIDRLKAQNRLLSDQIAAREAAAALAMKEAAAGMLNAHAAELRERDEQVRGIPKGMGVSWDATTLDMKAIAIRALLLPAAAQAALDAVVREAVAKERDAPREIAMGHGLVDVAVVNHEGRYGLRLKPRGHYVPVGEETAAPGSLMEIASGGGVLVWLDGAEFADTIINALNEAAAIRARGEAE